MLGWAMYVRTYTNEPPTHAHTRSRDWQLGKAIMHHPVWTYYLVYACASWIMGTFYSLLLFDIAPVLSFYIQLYLYRVLMLPFRVLDSHAHVQVKNRQHIPSNRRGQLCQNEKQCCLPCFFSNLKDSFVCVKTYSTDFKLSTFCSTCIGIALATVAWQLMLSW